MLLQILSRDYVPLNNGGRYEISEVEGTLKILRLQASDDGTYKCVASNLAGSVEATAEVDVMGKTTGIVMSSSGCCMPSVLVMCSVSLCSDI